MFLCLFDRESDTERGSETHTHANTEREIPSAGSLPNKHKGPGWGRLKSGAWNTVQVSMVAGVQALGPSSPAFPSTSARSQI